MAKIRAKKIVRDGITLRSLLEGQCYDLLKLNKVKFRYEPHVITIVPGFTSNVDSYERVTYGKKKDFKPKNPKILPITYKPDFVGDWWIIETKGHETPDFKVKWKLFKKYLKDNNITKYTLFKPHNKREILECISLIKLNDKKRDETREVSQGVASNEERTSKSSVSRLKSSLRGAAGNNKGYVGSHQRNRRRSGKAG